MIVYYVPDSFSCKINFVLLREAFVTSVDDVALKLMLAATSMAQRIYDALSALLVT